MSSENKYIRYGVGTVRPYLYGHLDLLDFIKQVFEAEELERNTTGKEGLHVEAKIGDSMLVLELGRPPETATRASIYVYVEDVDATYENAIRAGATSLAEPEDRSYQERNAGIRDTFGNVWWIATYTG